MSLKLLLGRKYVEARQNEAAEKIFKDLAVKAPSAEVYRGLFQLYRQGPGMGLGRAVLLINQTLEGNDQAPADPAQAQAMVSALRDDAELAKETVKVAFRISNRKVLNSATVLLLAALADRHRQLAEAERFYRLSLRQAAPGTENLLYSSLIRVLNKARKFEDVVKLCEKGLKEAGATNPALFHLEKSRALVRLDRLEEALAEADRGLDRAADPERLIFQLLRVRIFTMEEKFDKALAVCRTMLKESRKPAEVQEIHYLLSSVYSAAKNYPRAEEELALVIKLDPDNPTAHNDLGYIMADQGKNLKEAEELIRKAIDLDRKQRKNRASANGDQDNAAYIDSLGWVLFRRGQLDEARRELEKATALPDGEDPTIWDHLGDVYYRMGMGERARTAWQNALHLYEREKHRKMDPRHREVQRKLRLLDSARQP